MHIYHIVPAGAWNGLDGDSLGAGSLETEGFIHCSFANQLDSVIKRYFGDVKEIVVLEIDADRLVSKLVVEPSTGGEDYPHIYGPINTDAIVRVERRKIP